MVYYLCWTIRCGILTCITFSGFFWLFIYIHTTESFKVEETLVFLDPIPILLQEPINIIHFCDNSNSLLPGINLIMLLLYPLILPHVLPLCARRQGFLGVFFSSMLAILKINIQFTSFMLCDVAVGQRSDTK